MKSVISHFSLCLLSSLLLIGFDACKQNSDPDPQSSKFIEGQYQAKYINLTGSTIVGYPVNGQTLSMQIKSVAADTVQVNIQAPPNGKYSPGQNLSYPKALITSQVSAYGKILYYYVSLANPADRCGAQLLRIYSTGELDYYFNPPGNQPCTGVSVRFAKE